MDKHLLNFLLLFGLIGCSLGGPLREDRTAKRYRIHKPSGWDRPDWDVEADHVFVHPETKAVMSASSLCDRYPNASLSSLLKSALLPLSNVEIVKEDTLELHGRRALRQNVKAKLDGVPVELMVAIVRKDDCIFDFQLQRADKLTPADRQSYQELIETFRYSKYGNKYDNN